MVVIEEMGGKPIHSQSLEVVERKGLGHPDTMMDNIAEAVSVALAREYLKEFGSVLHYNIDKGLLAAGRAVNKFGGGKVLKPMRLVIGDRATFEWRGKKIPVNEIAVETAKEWIGKHLRLVDPEKNLSYEVALAPGSAQLVEIYSTAKKLKEANDTSAGVGFWPLSPTEKTVLSLEKFLNSKKFKRKFPETGEDVKVMALRKDDTLSITLAMPFIDRFINSEKDYFSRKEAVTVEIMKFLNGPESRFSEISLNFNALDQRGNGEEGVYLSVLGTSAEDADSGQVGRGNRVSGVISFGRPMTTEAAAGKNPVSHVGKIYTVLSHVLARHICEEVEGVEETYVSLVSCIGAPINKPQAISASLRVAKGRKLQDVSPRVREIIDSALSEKNLLSFTNALAQGKYQVC